MIPGWPQNVISLILIATCSNIFVSPVFAAERKTTSYRDAFRLLQQTTFGPTLADITEIIEIGQSAWIENQLNKPSAYDSDEDGFKTHYERLIEIALEFEPGAKWYANSVFNKGNASSHADNYQLYTWWENALGHPGNPTRGSDQLRQRVAYAWSQLFVIANTSEPLMDRGEALAIYYDILARNAFGNFRTLLGEVARNPAMGVYLTHQGNKKTDLQAGTSPDENFAREIIQLFTIGLYELNLDGTPNRDGNSSTYPDAGNELVPTYKQADIVDMAKVFTGWDLADNPRYGESWNRVGDFSRPMEFTPLYHEDESAEGGDGKVTVLGTTFALDSGEDGSAIDSALDVLFYHPNVGPYISRHLIMRLVTSNPTPEYIVRVAQVFNDNGKGIRGDLKAVVRSVLMDQQARSVSEKINPGFGKIKEPLLAYTQFLRAFRVRPLDGWSNYGTSAKGLYNDNPADDFGQAPLRASTVFNFYSPNFVPSDDYFTNNKMVAPEQQIQTDKMLVDFSNKIWLMVEKREANRIRHSEGESPEQYAKPYNEHANSLMLIDFDHELSIIEQVVDGDDNGDFAHLNSKEANGQSYRNKAIDALLTHLDALLLGNTMSKEYRAALTEYLQKGIKIKNDKFEQARQLVREAVRLIVVSSAFMVQK